MTYWELNKAIESRIAWWVPFVVPTALAAIIYCVGRAIDWWRGL